MANFTMEKLNEVLLSLHHVDCLENLARCFGIIKNSEVVKPQQQSFRVPRRCFAFGNLLNVIKQEYLLDLLRKIVLSIRYCKRLEFLVN